jgi:hypothetical protein
MVGSLWLLRRQQTVTIAGAARDACDLTVATTRAPAALRRTWHAGAQANPRDPPLETSRDDIHGGSSWTSFAVG